MVVAATGAAATNTEGSAKKTLTFSESEKVYSSSTGKARTRLDPLVIECGIKNNSQENNLQMNSRNIQDILQEARMPSLHCDVKLFWVVNAAIVKHPVEQGEMFSMFSSVASLAPILSPVLSTAHHSELMAFLEILMMTPKAQKKEVYSGLRSMFQAGTMT